MNRKPDDNSVLDSRTAIFFISGTQGAGKTTVSSILARRFRRGVHVSADTLQKMIVSGGEWPQARASKRDTSDFEGEAGRQLRLRLHNTALLARSFFDAGFTVVLDDIVVGDRLGHLLAELDDVDFLFVLLTPSLAAVREREHERGTELWREWEWLSEAVRSTPKVGLWLDSTGQTPEETVDEIMRRSWDEALVQPQRGGAKGGA